MTISGEPRASVLIIELEGEFDLAERDRLMDAFKVAQNSPIIVVNLEKATYIDSTVLACLVALRKATQQREASLFLVGLHLDVLRLFEVTGLREIFHIRTSLSDVPDAEFAQGRWLTIEAHPAPYRLRERPNGYPVRVVGSVSDGSTQQYWASAERDQEQQSRSEACVEHRSS